MLFFVEITDTYGGEANYSHVTRLQVRANTMLGAVNKVSRETGLSWHCVDCYGDQKRYDSKSGATCFFIEEYDIDRHGRTNSKEI